MGDEDGEEAEVERRVNEWRFELRAENVFPFDGIAAERGMEHRVMIRSEAWRGFVGVVGDCRDGSG